MKSTPKQLAIIGYPLKHTLSPIMHNTISKELGLNYHYTPYEVNPGTLQKAFEDFKNKNICGFNVTVPYKVDIIQYLDEISDEAKKIGAVNTVVNKNGKFIGYNTDAFGFITSLQEQIDLKNKKVFLIGAGGAARAIVYSLLKTKISALFIFDITKQKAEDIIKDFKKISYQDFTKNNIAKADIIINATPVGLHKEDKSIVNPDWLTQNQFCMDLIYNPEKTTFLLNAEKKGCRILNGLGMLAGQGAKGFELWTGVKPDVRRMEKILRSNLK